MLAFVTENLFLCALLAVPCVCVLFALLVFLLFSFVFDEFNKQFDNINKEERSM